MQKEPAQLFFVEPMECNRVDALPEKWFRSDDSPQGAGGDRKTCRAPMSVRESTGKETAPRHGPGENANGEMGGAESERGDRVQRMGAERASAPLEVSPPARAARPAETRRPVIISGATPASVPSLGTAEANRTRARFGLDRSRRRKVRALALP